MTNNKQQTAVEWYIIKRDEIEMKIRLMQICANQYEQELIKADEQAKALHKQEIINSFFEGAYGGDNISGEQYYNETYGGGEQ
jgi:hypothetical protein